MLARILAVTTVVAATLFGAAAAVIRQPLLTRSHAARLSGAAPARLRRHVEFLTRDVRPRDAAHSANLGAAAAYIERAFRAAGARVWLQTFSARKRDFSNVVAEFGPDDPSLPLLVVGAHYDAFGETGSLPGADDNASGTAALLEAARLLQHAPLRTPVMLVAYANEEPPFFGSEQMGSAVHAASIARRNVRGMICLEMIGYTTERQHWDSWVLSLFYPRRGDFIGVAGGWADRELARRVKANLDNAVSFTGPREMLDASDQRNYWARGWTAVMITDTAYERNPNYHTARDTAETLDYARMADVADGVATAVADLASR